MSAKRVILAGALCLVLTGCSDESGTDAAPADQGLDGAAADLAPDGLKNQRLTFYVYSPDSYGGADTPLKGATVALDLPGGKRVEKKTAADGKVSFDGIDYSAGAAVATAHLAGYTMHTRAGLDPEELAAMAPLYREGGALKLPIYDLTPATPEYVTVSGTATGFKDSTHGYAVNVLGTKVATEWTGNSSQTFSVVAPKGKPFTIQALEVERKNLPSGQGYRMMIHRVMHKDLGPVTQSTGVVLDLAADEVTTKTADANVAIPSRTASPLRAGYPACLVIDASARYAHGWAAKAEVVPASDRLEVSFVWTTPTWAKEVTSACYVANGVSGDISYVYVDGDPAAGAITPPMFDVPCWITPADTSKAAPLRSELKWELFEKDVLTFVLVYKDKTAVWSIYAGTDATSLTLPQLPSTVDKAAFFGSKDLQAIVGAYTLNKAGTRASRLARSQARRLKP